jgi:alpha-glucosidase (family GH31 glycosyl hydrolase)
MMRITMGHPPRSMLRAAVLRAAVLRAAVLRAAVLRAAVLRAASVVALIACGEAAGPSPPDAGAPSPISLRLSAGAGTVIVESDPLRIHVERDGTPLISSSTPALELGIAPGGATLFHPPIEADPTFVDWHALDLGAGSTGDTDATIRDGAGHSARIALSAVEGGGAIRVRITSDDPDVALIRLRLADDGGAYHGLGERFGGADARGSIVPMQLALGDAQARTSGINEHHVPVPFVVSSRAWGLFVESREAGAFDVAATDPREVRATFEGGVLDLVFFVAGAPREVIAAYTRHTGLPILPPRWAFAPMHWRNEWPSRAVLEEDLARIRAEDIPCTTFWIDNPWQVSYNDLVFDETRFPDAPQMLGAMRDAGYVPLLWSTPYLDRVEDGAAPASTAEALFVEARDRSLLVTGRDGAPFDPPSSINVVGASAGLVDFTSAEARAFWQERVASTVALGVRAFKLDYGEDVVPEVFGRRIGLRFADGTTERETHNVFAMLYHRAYRSALDEGAGPDGGFLLVRASAWGGQAVADIVWPGDLDNDLRPAGERDVGGLPAAISGLVSLAASGFPTFGSDTGGYRGGMPDRESLLRWAEHTAFTPILQLGGAGEHHNPWLYDEEAGAIYRALARAHMDLVPYFRIHAIRASTDGTPPVLHPALAYPEDRDGYGDPNAYLLGPDLFVAPVVVPGATSRQVRVPPGRWVHWLTGQTFDGPSDATIDAPIGTPVVLARVGAIVPLLPADLDTLVEAEPPVVSPSQRPFLRVRVLPGAPHAITTEEGIQIRAARAPESIGLEIVAAEGADLRLEIDLASADPPLPLASEVRADGRVVIASVDPASVRAGCATTCWAREGEVVYLAVRGPTSTRFEIR